MFVPTGVLPVPLKFMINTYKLGCSATTPGDAMSNVQLPRKGVIRQISIAAMDVLEADSFFSLQVVVNRAGASFNASSNVPTNILAEVCTQCMLTTSGVSNSGVNVVFPQNFPVVERDILYLHGLGTTSTSGVTCNVVVQIEES